MADQLETNTNLNTDRVGTEVEIEKPETGRKLFDNLDTPRMGKESSFSAPEIEEDIGIN